jgi:hypothetical protein
MILEDQYYQGNRMVQRVLEVLDCLLVLPVQVFLSSLVDQAHPVVLEDQLHQVRLPYPMDLEHRLDLETQELLQVLMLLEFLETLKAQMVLEHPTLQKTLMGQQVLEHLVYLEHLDYLQDLQDHSLPLNRMDLELRHFQGIHLGRMVLAILDCLVDPGPLKCPVSQSDQLVLPPLGLH